VSPLYKKLLLWFWAANIAVLLVSVFVTNSIGRAVGNNEPDWDHLASEAVQRYQSQGLLGLAAYSEELRRSRGVDATLYRHDKNLLLRRTAPPLRPFLPQLLAADRLVLKAGDGFWLAGQTVTTASGEPLQFIAMRGPHAPHERRGLLLLVQIVLSLVVIGGLGFAVARSLTAPITAIQSATRKMADGDLAARADARTAGRDDELGALARDFNHMASRTEALVGQQRTVLQDVSHELRSPLARLHLLLELSRQGANSDSQRQLDRAAREVTRLDTLIGEVLNLSRLETTLPGMATTPVWLDALIADVMEEHALEADARHITLSASTPVRLCVQGDAALLARAVGNVLGNAIKFSPAHRPIALSLSQHGEQALIEVRDHGPGVPPENISRLFQPFFRGHNAALAEGHGLGLAIAQRIVSAHEGHIAAQNAAGGGLAVTLSLPLKPGTA